MSRRKDRQSEGGPKVPGYIVTFSDMVTLLLTFFVMLLSLATMQDPELFNVGRDSFVEALKGYGLGMLIGKDQSMDFTDPKIKYLIENPEETAQKRTLDAKEERLRRVFDQLRENAKTMPSPVPNKSGSFPLSDVQFEPGSAELNEKAKDSVTKICQNLLEKSIETKLYVLGLTKQGSTGKQQWQLSAQRANAVAAFIRRTFPPSKLANVYSWGAGPGRSWTGENTSIPETDCQIVIGVFRE